MIILIISHDKTYDYIIPALIEAGHTVHHISASYNGPSIIWPTADTFTHINEQIALLQPDIVVNAMPHLWNIDVGSALNLGNTELSARLETCKSETRDVAETLGWKVPSVLYRGSSHLIDIESSTPSYVKPTDNATSHITVKIPDSNIPSQMLRDPAYDCYVEAGVQSVLEAWAYFTIADGKWSINRVMAATNYGDDKLIEREGDNWALGITLHDLTAEQDLAFRAKVTSFLEYAVTKGGNYQGNIGGAITENLDVYWFEVNCRPETYSSDRPPSDIADWITGLTDTPTLLDGQLTAQQVTANINQ